MRALVIGNGAREHAIAKKLHGDGAELISAMAKRNPGIAAISKRVELIDINKPGDYDRFKGIDIAFIGPEAPLAEGITDHLNSLGVPVVGPRKSLARLEWSKSYARVLLQEKGIPGNPEFRVCRSLSEVRTFLIDHPNVAVKPEGLTGGKGVRLTGEQLRSPREVEDYASECISKDGLVVLEEKLRGKEFTLQAFVDGTQSIGSLAWEADRWGVDFVATSTYKWLMGGHYGQSAGFLFVSKPNIDATQPVYVGEKTLPPEVGERNTLDEFTLYDYTPRKGLERIEVFPRQEISYVAVENSMKVLLAHGKKAVERQVRDVDNRLIEELTKRHFRLQTPKEEERRIYVNVQVPDYKGVGEKLLARNIHVAPRIGGLRISPHFYNTEEEAVALVKALREVTKPR